MTRLNQITCKLAGLKLLVMSYKDIDNIKAILDKELL